MRNLLYELLETTEEMTGTKNAQKLEENKPIENIADYFPYAASFFKT